VYILIQLYNAQINNNNLEIIISRCPARETAKHKILWQMADEQMKTHAMQHHYHGEANTVVSCTFSTFAGMLFSSGEGDSGKWGRGIASIHQPDLILFYLMTTKLVTWHAEIHLGCKLSLLTKHAVFCWFILLFFEVSLLQVLFGYFCFNNHFQYHQDSKYEIWQLQSP